jgi:hypothetical protein
MTHSSQFWILDFGLWIIGVGRLDLVRSGFQQFDQSKIKNPKSKIAKVMSILILDFVGVGRLDLVRSGF